MGVFSDLIQKASLPIIVRRRRKRRRGRRNFCKRIDNRKAWAAYI
jgi:hypothetical protein